MPSARFTPQRVQTGVALLDNPEAPVPDSGAGSFAGTSAAIQLQPRFRLRIGSGVRGLGMLLTFLGLGFAPEEPVRN